jgi:hypothetical protein
MEDRTEILWRAYQSHLSSSQHYEEQRSKITQAVLILSGAVLALLKLGEPNMFVGTLVAAYLIVVGSFGAFFTHRTAKECNVERNCAQDYLEKLALAVPNTFEEMEMEEPSFPILPWLLVHGLVVVLGILILIYGLNHEGR